MGNYEQQTRFSRNVPIRAVRAEQTPFVQKRPVVDVPGLASKAANEVIQTLAEWREKEAKAGRSFLKRRQSKPDINIASVADSLREAVLEAYRTSGAACTPPVDLTEEHLSEVRRLQEQAIEVFSRQLLPAVIDDAALVEQVYQICPALRPAPGPDEATLSNLQKQVDKALATAMAIHEKLVMSLRELDGLVRQEAVVLAGTNQAGTGRIQRQAEYVRHELVRLLERQEIAKSLRIPAARW